MAKLLRSDRVRLTLLNGTLLLVFVTAWVSDRWPEFTLTAIVIACAVVLGEAILLYVSAREAAACKEPPPKVIENQHVMHDYNLPVAPAQQARLTNRAEEVITEFAMRQVELRYRDRLALHHEYMPEALRPRAGRVSSWSLGALQEDQTLCLAFVREYFRLARERGRLVPIRPQVPDELAKWELITHGRESFNIVAGSFVIEHFHGRTNIRVLDPLRVTVEGEKRGAKSKVAPPEIDAPIYQ